MKKKFAITKFVGEKEVVLKTFDHKDEAVAYGSETAKNNPGSIISCVYALFNDEGKMNNRDLIIFEIWT